MASVSTITQCLTHHHHNDFMTTTPLSECKTSQGIFHTQTQRRAECTSSSRGHQQWLASQHRLLPSRHRSRELISANGSTHREEEEFTSMNSGQPSSGGSADVRRMETDIEKPSIVADKATADIKEEQLTSAWADAAHQQLGVPLAHRMADEATATAEAHIFTSKVAIDNSHQRTITTNCSIPVLPLGQRWPEHKGSLQDIRLRVSSRHSSTSSASFCTSCTSVTSRL